MTMDILIATLQIENNGAMFPKIIYFDRKPVDKVYNVQLNKQQSNNSLLLEIWS